RRSASPASSGSATASRSTTRPGRRSRPRRRVSASMPRPTEPRREMMLAEYNGFCAGLPATHHVVQWGGADVWKVGSKVFAIARERDDGGLDVTFKCSDMAFEMLKGEPGLRPAPYLASRGMSWFQRQT